MTTKKRSKKTKTALAKRDAKKGRTKTALAKVKDPTLGQVVNEVRRQREDIRQIVQAPSLAAAFCSWLAGALGVPFTGSSSDFDELRNVIAIRLAQTEHAVDLDHTFGKLNMAFGAGGHVNEADLVDAVRCYRNLVNELLVDGGQTVLDKVRALKLQAARMDEIDATQRTTQQ